MRCVAVKVAGGQVQQRWHCCSISLPIIWRGAHESQAICFTAGFAVGDGMGLAAGAASAADYPARPIRFIIPPRRAARPTDWPDIRRADERGARQQVVVDNRPARPVSSRAKSPRTRRRWLHDLLPYHQHTVNAALNPKLPYHPVNDFTPITQLTEAGLLLVIHPLRRPRPPGSSLNGRATQGRAQLRLGGIGSGGHLAGELYNLMAGVKAQHIPYKGTARR